MEKIYVIHRICHMQKFANFEKYFKGKKEMAVSKNTKSRLLFGLPVGFGLYFSFFFVHARMFAVFCKRQNSTCLNSSL